jgi:predicted glutamine amidotransferase
MCKVFMTAGIKPENQENAWALAKDMAETMSVTENDGLGYAAITRTGELFGERWFFNSQAFKSRPRRTDIDEQIEQFLTGAMKPVGEIYNKWGSIQDNSLSAIIVHARYATSAKTFNNTHPFVVGDTALIHNGIIRNVKELHLFQSSCDSETILNEYLKHEVMVNPENIQKVADRLSGYYACGVLSRNGEDVPILDVFKDEGANLYASHIKEVGLVFATSNKDVRDVCNRLGFQVLSSYQVNAGFLIRINALTGEFMGNYPFKPEYKYEVTNVKTVKSPKLVKKLANSTGASTTDDLDEWSLTDIGYHKRKVR